MKQDELQKQTGRAGQATEGDVAGEAGRAAAASADCVVAAALNARGANTESVGARLAVAGAIYEAGNARSIVESTGSQPASTRPDGTLAVLEPTGTRPDAAGAVLEPTGTCPDAARAVPVLAGRCPNAAAVAPDPASTRPDATDDGIPAHAIPYPLFLYLGNMKVVCVGGGRCAERKVESLVGYGATVTVIAPEATARIRELAGEGSVALVERPYRSGDLEGATFVIGATNNAQVNHQVFLEATRRHQIVNVVDDPENCNAILPSVLRRGDFQVAVSTAGAAPGVARQVRRELEQKFPAWYGDYIDLLGEVRALIKARVVGETARRAPLYEAVYACGLEERLARGERPTAEEVYAWVVVPLLDGRRQP